MEMRDKQIAGLREFADFLETHPDVPMENWRINVSYYTYDDETVKAAARAATGWTKIYTDSYLDLAMYFGLDGAEPDDGQRTAGLKFIISVPRDQVCTKRVVGTKVVEKPDPEFIKQARKDAPIVEVEEEVVEWDCHPLLAPSEG